MKIKWGWGQTRVEGRTIVCFLITTASVAIGVTLYGLMKYIYDEIQHVGV